MTGKTSIIIPAYNEEAELPGLIDSLKKQTVKPCEAILVDDGSTDRTIAMASSYFKIIRSPKRGGPGAARNLAMKVAKGDYFAFIDADCRPYPDWIQQIEKAFHNSKIRVITGGTRVFSDTFLGQSVAALGFPGGGALGFSKMWRIGPDGSVSRLSSGNFAMRKGVFIKNGGFDDTFTYYCEDAWFAQNLVRSGVVIYYIPEMDIRHAPVEDLWQFIRWHLNRGRGNFVFKQKMGKVGDFVKLRIWSTMNMVKIYYRDIKFPLIFILLVLSFICQQVGYFMEKKRRHN